MSECVGTVLYMDGLSAADFLTKHVLASQDRQVMQRAVDRVLQRIAELERENALLRNYIRALEGQA
jgi:hypothetical protein